MLVSFCKNKLFKFIFVISISSSLILPFFSFSSSSDIFTLDKNLLFEFSNLFSFSSFVSFLFSRSFLLSSDWELFLNRFILELSSENKLFIFILFLENSWSKVFPSLDLLSNKDFSLLCSVLLNKGFIFSLSSSEGIGLSLFSSLLSSYEIVSDFFRVEEFSLSFNLYSFLISLFFSFIFSSTLLSLIISSLGLFSFSSFLSKSGLEPDFIPSLPKRLVSPNKFVSLL